MRKPCRVCGRVSAQAICPIHRKAAQAARPSRQARGLDAEYDRNRAALLDRVRPAVRAHPCTCPPAPRAPAVNSQTETQSHNLWCPTCGAPACVICGRGFTLADLAPGKLTAEHLRPRRDGGSNELANLGPAHASCNYGWRARRGTVN